ncbi:MAG: hypothetical protein JSV91_06120 [Phycisphaerales bacterium]|nr:MAG: hypothetical protein JSV91_06120 [Phycisphaerales bacterium]
MSRFSIDSLCFTISRSSRTGGVLLEILVSIAIFVGAATFALRAVTSVINALDRSRREAYAVDLARSKLAELEADLITLADLRGEGREAVGSLAEAGFDESSLYEIGARQWVFDVTTTRSEFTGLSLIELTVTEEPVDEFAGAENPVSFTLRQLIRLREEAEEEYEMDDMLRGLPGAGDSTGFPEAGP